MTNTEKIRQEIERRIGAMYNFSDGYSALNVCRELLDFIDKLPKETQQGWISVKDRLPEIDKEVIVLSDNIHDKYVKNAHRISFGHIVDKTYCKDYDGWNFPYVTHWIPCPPIEGEDENLRKEE